MYLLSHKSNLVAYCFSRIIKTQHDLLTVKFWIRRNQPKSSFCCLVLSLTYKITHKQHLIPDHTARIRHPILDHTTCMRHSHCRGYRRSSFYYFDSYQILCFSKSYAFGKHNGSRTSHGFNGNIFKDVNTLKTFLFFLQHFKEESLNGLPCLTL